MKVFAYHYPQALRHLKRWRSGLAGRNELVGVGGGFFWRWFTRAERSGRLELGGLFGVNPSQGVQEGVVVVAVRGCGQGVYEVGNGGFRSEERRVGAEG